MNECTNIDNDDDGIINSIDIDDDNDGILDINESGCSTALLSSLPNLSNQNQAYISNLDHLDVTFTRLTSQNIPLLNGVGGNKEYDIKKNGHLRVDFSNNVTFLKMSLGDFDKQEHLSVLIYDQDNNLITDVSPYLNVTQLGSEIDEHYNEGINSFRISTTFNAGAPSATLNNIYDFELSNIQISRIEFTDIATHNQDRAAELYFHEICILDDQDGDGIINSFDLDSDNDGCSDAEEAGFTGFDQTGESHDSFGNNFSHTPVGTNGLSDGLETTVDGGTTIITPDYTSVYNGISTCP